MREGRRKIDGFFGALNNHDSTCFDEGERKRIVIKQQCVRGGGKSMVFLVH